MGTKRRSPGWPRLLGAYSMTRYSRVAPCTSRVTISTYLPTPCASCTTKSPGLSSSGSIAFLRRAGILRSALSAAPFTPARSPEVNTRRLTRSTRNPRGTSATTIDTRPARSFSASTSPNRWARPVASATSTTSKPDATASAIAPTAASRSPRNGSFSSARMWRDSGSSAKADIVHQARPRPKAAARTSASWW